MDKDFFAHRMLTANILVINLSAVMIAQFLYILLNAKPHLSLENTIILYILILGLLVCIFVGIANIFMLRRSNHNKAKDKESKHE